MSLLNYLKEFDTAEISDALDALGIEGALLDIKPLFPGVKMVGPAFTVKYLPYKTKPIVFKGAAEYIDTVPPHSVIVIDNNGRQDCTTWGDILTNVAMMNQIAGTVVFGAVRDVSFIRSVGYPLFTKHIYMRSGKNRVYKSQQQCEINIQEIIIRPNDIIFGDENGVIVIPLEHIQNVLEKARNIRATEYAIITAVKNGVTLQEARKTYRYDQPWLNGKHVR
jgi:regulator of RNase E activity RraA